MEKLYRQLRWLDIGQAVNYLQCLTATPLSERELLQSGRSRLIDVYVEIDPRGLTGTTSDNKKKVTLTGMQQVLNPDEALERGADQTCAVLKHGDVHWIGLLPSWSQKALFKSEDIQTLADKMNEVVGQAAGTELEDLRRELEQERARREAAEADAAELRQALQAEEEKPLDRRERASFERLLYVLAKDADYKLSAPYSDEIAIQQSAASFGAKVPTGNGAIAKYLEAAVARAEQDRKE